MSHAPILSERSHVHAADGLRLERYRWRPPADAPTPGGPPRLLLVHGLGEHLGRYEHVGAWWARRGWEVVGVDFRGFGRSDGRRACIRRWSDYHLDLDAVAPGAPFALLAHSMGGLVALDWLRRRQLAAGTALPEVALFSGPLLGMHFRPPWWKELPAPVLSRLLPCLRLPSGLDTQGLCNDRDAVERFESDPLRVAVVTPRWYEEMKRALRRVRDFVPEYRVPAQFHLGGDDRTVSRHAVRETAKRWPVQAELWEWDRGAHEVLQEPFWEEVLEVMARAVTDGIRDDSRAA